MTDTAVVLRSPAALIASVPSLLGFIPEQSVVAIWIKDGTILVTQRADIDPALDNPRSLTTPVMQHKPDEVILTFWSDRSPEDDPKDFDEKIEALIEHAKADVYVRDALWVHRGAWGSLVCSEPSCCPPSGHPIDFSLAPDLGKGEPVSHRETLLAECAPAGAEHMKALNPHGREQWRDKAIDYAIAAYLSDDDSEKVAARVGRSLHDIRVRDTLLWEIAQLDDEDIHRAYLKLAKASRAMHVDDAAPAASLAAICAWMLGDGARANVALDVAQKADAGYSLAMLVHMSMGSGLHPSVWRESVTGMTRDECRNGKK